MERSERHRARLMGWHRLEARSLLSTVATRATVAAGPPVVPGNRGHLLKSQFQSGPFGEVGAQWRQILVGGPIRFHLEPADLDVPPSPHPVRGASNTGNIERSQFNPFGFSDLGSQLKGV